MGTTILLGFLLLLAIVGAFLWFRFRGQNNGRASAIAAIAGGAFLLIALVVGFSATFYTNAVNTAKVFVSFDGTVQSVRTDPGAGFKAPWTRAVEFDLSSQKLSFAGNGSGTPSYTGGEVNGQQITAAVKGGAQSNFDLQMTYNIDATKVKSIYEDYRSQENFSAQVIVPKVLSAVRKVPAQYDAVAFRGENQGAAQEQMIEQANKALKPFGVKVTVGALQNITYSAQVEKSITAVLQAQQKQQKAEANLQAAKVAAEQKQVEAQATADANNKIAASLTPEVLQSQELDTLKSIGANGNTVVVPSGTSPFLNIQGSGK